MSSLRKAHSVWFVTLTKWQVNEVCSVFGDGTSESFGGALLSTNVLSWLNFTRFEGGSWSLCSSSDDTVFESFESVNMNQFIRSIFMMLFIVYTDILFFGLVYLQENYSQRGLVFYWRMYWNWMSVTLERNVEKYTLSSRRYFWKWNYIKVSLVFVLMDPCVPANYGRELLKWKCLV
jgi:hypothetical protein